MKYKKVCKILIVILISILAGFSFLCETPNEKLQKVLIVIWNKNAFNRSILSKNDLESYRYYNLKYLGEKVYNIQVETQKKYKPEESDIIFSVVPLKKHNYKEFKDKSTIFLLESPISNGGIENTGNFKKVFTYDSTVIDNKRYFHLMIPYFFMKPFNEIPLSDKKVFSMQVAGNHEYKSYNLRRHLVRWFMENQPKDLLFYGNSWNNLKNDLSQKAQESFDEQYGGYVPDKIKAIRNSRFVFAFENAQHNGYISEKIFDVMLADSVPVYWGAPDIDNYVPKDCFINYEDFGSFDKLYQFIKNMSDEEYENYRKNIRKFMKQFDQTPFFYKTFIQRVYNGIMDEPYYLVRYNNKWETLIPNNKKINRYCLETNKKICGRIRVFNDKIISIQWMNKLSSTYIQNKWGNYVPVK